MKNYLLLLCLLSTLSLSSQSLFNTYEEGAVYFNDGSRLDGFLKINTNKRIIFKRTLKTKKQVFNYDTVKKVKGINMGILYYKKSKGYNFWLKKEIEGKLELYSETLFLPTGKFSGSYYTYYFIGNSKSNIVDRVPEWRGSKKSRRVLSKYTSDCKRFTVLIQNEIRIKKTFNSSIHKMVEFYNTRCN